MFYEIKNHITRSKMSYGEMVKNMTKEEAVAVMLESINSDNMSMGLQAGFTAEDLQEQIEVSRPSLTFMMSNIYDKLRDSGVIT